MTNTIVGSPVALAANPMFDRIPAVPPGPYSKVGSKGHLYTAVDGLTHYGLAETTDGDFVFCWFDGRERIDTPVRTRSKFQNPHLGGDGRALVIGAGNRELLAVARDGQVESLGSAPEGQMLTKATWTRSGFAAVDGDGAIHVYRWTPGTAPAGAGRYKVHFSDDIRAAGEVGDILVSCEMDSVVVLDLGDPVTVLARFSLSFHSTFQCTDESGRHIWILPADTISDGGGQHRLDNLEAAWEKRAELPAAERVGDAAELSAGSAPRATPVEVATTGPRVTARRARGYHSRALLAMLEARGVAERETPDLQIAELLALPVDDDLAAYLSFRARHGDPGVIAIYEAWLDTPPRRVTDARALGDASDAIELGILANGDRIIARLGGDRDAQIVELSHDEDVVRPFRDLEAWLASVVGRTGDPTDLAPYL